MWQEGADNVNAIFNGTMGTYNVPVDICTYPRSVLGGGNVVADALSYGENRAGLSKGGKVRVWEAGSAHIIEHELHHILMSQSPLFQKLIKDHAVCVLLEDQSEVCASLYYIGKDQYGKLYYDNGHFGKKRTNGKAVNIYPCFPHTQPQQEIAPYIRLVFGRMRYPINDEAYWQKQLADEISREPLLSSEDAIDKNFIEKPPQIITASEKN